MIVRQIKASETHDLRSRVLRPGAPVAASHYPNDEEGVHFGLFESDELLSVVSAFPEDNPLFSTEGQWRIRGMATEPARQGQKLGRRLLEALLSWGRSEGIPLFWCNARAGAIPFYERSGFKVESDLFEIAGIGPHKVMRIDL